MRSRKGFLALLVLEVSLVQAAPVRAGNVAAGSSHVVVAKPDGSVWAWGYNSSAQLGDGTTTSRAVPTEVVGLTDVVAVAAGASHSLALKNDGSVWAWGSNGYGQVGDNTTIRRDTPVSIGLTNIVAIAAGDNHSLALQSDGTVWIWGYNGNGQLGTGGTSNSLLPVALGTISAVSAIDAGSNHTLVVKSDGTVWACGSNQYGQLGDGTTTQRNAPVQMSGITGAVAVAGGALHSLVLLNNGNVKAVGYNGNGQLGDTTYTQRTSPVSVSGLTGATAIEAGGHTSGARKADGTLVLWGANGNGQIGDGTTTTRPSATAPTGLPSGMSLLALGNAFTLAVTSDGVVWAWGYNSYGALGDGTTLTRSTGLSISGPNYDWNVGTPAFNYGTGTYYNTLSVIVTEATPGAEIHYTLNGDDPTEADPIVASGGTVLIDRVSTLKARAWKADTPTSRLASAVYTLTVSTPTFNPYPQTYTTAQTVTLSTSTSGATIRYTTDGTSPTEASTAYTGPFVVEHTTTLKVAGFRTDWVSSSINTGTYTMNFGTLAAPAVSPAAGTYVTSATVTLSAMAGATIRYTTNGATPTAASPIYTDAFEVTVTTTVKAIATHPDYTTSAVMTAVYTIAVAAPTFTPPGGTYAAGQTIIVATATPGATMTYTLNGIEPTTSDPSIASGGTLVAGNYTLKVKAWKTGATPTTATAAYAVTGGDASATLAAGDSHSLAIRRDGTLWAWGSGGSGQLGDGTATTHVLPVLVPGITGATAIAGGSAHSLVTTVTGGAFGMGGNGSGQIGDATTSSRYSPVSASTTDSLVSVAAGSSHSLGLTSDGRVLAWGYNWYGQLGDGATTNRTAPAEVPGLTGVVAVAAGGHVSVALKSDGTVWTWGDNTYGQLGDGTTTTRGTPAPVTLPATIVAVAAGRVHVLALANNGSVWAWGHNGYGELGDGSTTDRKTPVLATALPSVQAIAVGASHSIGLASDGSVWTWGSNASGQLGDGTTNARATPAPIATLSGIVKIAAGASHSLALTSDLVVYAWGDNGYGQHGDGSSTGHLTPVPVSGADMVWLPPAPVISLNSARYFVEQQATIASPDPAATIHYTTNGASPTEADPVVASGGTVSITQSLTLTARAFKPGIPPSAPATATYELKVGTPSLSVAGGPYGTAQTVTLTTVSPAAELHYTTTGIEPTLSDPWVASGGTVALDASATLRVKGFRANWLPSDAITATYWLTLGTVATPTFSPSAGAFTSPQTVTIGTATAGATIRYTRDGTDPTFTSPLYVAPLSVASDTVIKARAFKADWQPSAIATASYTIDLGTVSTPTLSPSGGALAAMQLVTVTTATAGATMHYTLTGLDPTESDPIVASGGTILVDHALRLKVAAWQSGVPPSGVAVADYWFAGAVAAGREHTLVLSTDGRVFAFGRNDAGQLGDATATDRHSPVPVSGLTDAVAIAAGARHSLAVRRDGTIVAWGANTSGQLGDGSTTTRNAPVAVSGLTDVIAVAAGEVHSLALRRDGSVWAWGANSQFQLGLGTGSTANRTTPVVVPNLAGIVRIAANGSSSLALRTDGTGEASVWSWGSNADGQLGDGTSVSRDSPARGLIGVVAMAAGSRHAMWHMADGRLLGAGLNDLGQLGDGTTAAHYTPVPVATDMVFTALSAGDQHTLGLATEGTLWGWGGNGSGQVGDTSMTSHGGSLLQPTHIITVGTDIITIAAGGYHSVALTRSGRLYTWGGNAYGQLGDSTTTGHNEPIALANFSVLDNTWLMSDPDGDGLPTWRELQVGTDPLKADTNGDGILDGAAVASGIDPLSADTDADGVPNVVEIAQGTDPLNADTDRDGVNDAVDAFPLDPTRWQAPQPVPGDVTPPVITLTEPTNAVLIPPPL